MSYGIEAPERRWLIIVRAENKVTTATTVKAVTDIVERMSRGKCHLAFSTGDMTAAGVFAHIAKPAKVISATLEKACTAKDRDFIMVLELGDEFAAVGNSAGWRWLQH